MRVSGEGLWKGASIEDSGLGGRRGASRQELCARAPRPQCVPFESVEGREASAPGSHCRRGQMGQPEAGDAGRACRVYSRGDCEMDRL